MLLTRNYHAKVRADATSVKVERRFHVDPAFAALRRG
jgi:hypothetical protein